MNQKLIARGHDNLLGAIIKAWQKKMKITNPAAAKELGVTLRTYGDWKGGQHAPHGSETVECPVCQKHVATMLHQPIIGRSEIRLRSHTGKTNRSYCPASYSRCESPNARMSEPRTKDL
jgi:hypothetical protein